jgi:hypothetical protein
MTKSTYAQHEMHHMHYTDSKKDTNKTSHAVHSHDSTNHQMEMSSRNSVNLPMNRDGSGTSWQPDATPIYAYMLHKQQWMFMFHGDVFIRYNRQDIGNKGVRGGEQWDAPSMLMAMAQRRIGNNGVFQFNAMLSADALISGGNGYPLLFQSGETWQGKPLIDRQHPHDLFSELSVSYAHSLSSKADVSLYLGYPGEPALGPVTFMHRLSGRFNPDAPIGHHWVDATHITFGVATVGFRYGKFRLEGSSFTGREPDENRYNFDKPLFNSWSGRLSFNPSKQWALQASHGFIKSPEAHAPGEDVRKTTVSAMYMRPIKTNNFFTGTVLWGQNSAKGHHTSNSVLGEASLRQNRLVFYTRYEWVQKGGEELVLAPTAYDHGTLFTNNVITFGSSYDLLKVAHVIVAGGGQLSVNFIDKRLEYLYGNKPIAGEIYLHIYPQLMKTQKGKHHSKM